jgi:hypothetical protein
VCAASADGNTAENPFSAWVQWGGDMGERGGRPEEPGECIASGTSKHAHPCSASTVPRFTARPPGGGATNRHHDGILYPAANYPLSANDQTFFDTFHEYSMEWGPEFIKIGLDGKVSCAPSGGP